MKSIPVISKYMTTTPLVIESTASLADAESMMHKNNIRHLPVMAGSAIYGVISDRDVHTFLGLKGADLKSEPLNSVCIKDPLVVKSDAKLNTVCDLMAENKFGSVLVEDNNKIVGIFTWIDALRAMGELLETRLKK